MSGVHYITHQCRLERDRVDVSAGWRITWNVVIDTGEGAITTITDVIDFIKDLNSSHKMTEGKLVLSWSVDKEDGQHTSSCIQMYHQEQMSSADVRIRPLSRADWKVSPTRWKESIILVLILLTGFHYWYFRLCLFLHFFGGQIANHRRKKRKWVHRFCAYPSCTWIFF